MLGGSELSGENEDYIITSGGFEIKSLSAVAGYSSVETQANQEQEDSRRRRRRSRAIPDVGTFHQLLLRTVNCVLDVQDRHVDSLTSKPVAGDKWN